MDSCPLDDFKQRATEILQQLKTTGKPLELTVNGEAQVVIQDVEAYLTMIDRFEALIGIEAGLEDVRQGRVTPYEEVIARLRERASNSRQAPVTREANEPG